jgi:mono/diheme cytochrome c family protein
MVATIGTKYAALEDVRSVDHATAPAHGREGMEGIAAGFFRMMRGRMLRPTKSILLPLLAIALALPLAACGEQTIEVPSSSPQHAGAELFQQRCAGCHTFEAAATQGGSANVRTRERTDGPNFNTRPECIERVLYAIENGGFSGAIMPANIVVGDEARAVAEFVARYAGAEADGQRPAGSGSEANGFRCTGQSGDAGQ